MGGVFAYTHMRPIFSLLLLSTSLIAQRGVPPAVLHAAPAKAAAAAPGARYALRAAPERWLEPVSASERAAKKVRAGLTQIGMHRGVSEANLEGSWQTARDGSQIWRLVLRSPGAAGIRLHMEEFHAGPGRLWISELQGDKPQTFGPYTLDGIHNDGEFWTNTALGEAVLIEFETTSRSRTLPFRISEISHLTEFPVQFGKGGAELGLAKVGEERNAALRCNLDVNCYPEYAELARAVARYSFETSEGGALCSGTVMNTRNSSMIPYFLTAAHCVSSDTEARTVEAFFLYQTQSCNGPAPSTSSVPRALGARYLAGNSIEGGDFTLLRLNSVPNGTIFAGWTPDEHPVGAAVTGIHHPTGDLKKISFGARGDYINSRGRPAQNFYTILWREGVTEGGSSGSGIFNDQKQLVGMLSGGPRPPAGQTECDLRPAFDWYGRFDVAFPQIRNFLEDRAGGSTGGGTTAPPTGNVLTSGTAAQVTFPAVSSSTLYNGSQGYRVVVPEGATELEITLATANGDLDLFVSYDSDPTIDSGRIRSDYNSISDSGNERIVINGRSSPALRAGTYYIAVASYTTGRDIPATLTARITTPGGGGSTPGGGTGATTTLLTSGTSRNFTLPAVTGGTLFRGAQAYRIDVPAGATQLQIRVNTTTPNADVDLFARFGAEVVVENGRVTADHKSDGATGNEVITITPQSSPTLRTGTYYIALGLFTNGIEVTGSVTATVTTGGGGGGSTGPTTLLTSGVSRNFSVPAVTGGTLFSGAQAYRIDVPAGSTQLQIRVNTTTPNADIDLFARFGTEVTVENSRVVADHRSESETGNETITITAQSNPALRAGTYYIALGLFTNGVAVNGSITATVTGGSTGGGGGSPVSLLSGVSQTVNIPATASPSLTGGSLAYTITVPEGARRLLINYQASTPDVDVDMYVKFGQLATVVGGKPNADYASEGPAGEERIEITAASNPPLKAGTYYIQFANFTNTKAVSGSLQAVVELGAPAPVEPQAPTVLSSGLPGKMALPAVEGPILFTGNYGYRIQVPEGASRLTIRLATATPNADVDLYVRYGADVDLTAEGEIIADHYSESLTGNEVIVITSESNPPLRAGTYYIATALFTPGVAVTGSVTATVERAPTATPAVGRELTFDTPTSFSLPAVEGPILFGGSNVFRVNVNQPGGLKFELRTDTPGVDVDVHVRFQQPPAIENGRIAADFSATGDTGNEDLTVLPNLIGNRLGTYYVALALYTPGVPVNGTLLVRPIAPGTSGDAKREMLTVDKSSGSETLKPKIQFRQE